MSKQNLSPGDRVAYSAQFLRNTGQFTGSGGARRGTFLKYDETAPQFARVRWDDFDAKRAMLATRYGEDYVADAVANGQMVLATNIARVGSAAFAAH